MEIDSGGISGPDLSVEELNAIRAREESLFDRLRLGRWRRRGLNRSTRTQDGGRTQGAEQRRRPSICAKRKSTGRHLLSKWVGSRMALHRRLTPRSAAGGEPVRCSAQVDAQ